jgi:hypothetical protein
MIGRVSVMSVGTVVGAQVRVLGASGERLQEHFEVLLKKPVVAHIGEIEIAHTIHKRGLCI